MSNFFLQRSVSLILMANIFLLIAPAPSSAQPGDLTTADTTISWTNNLGIEVDVSGNELLIAESRLTLSEKTSYLPHDGRMQIVFDGRAL